MIEDPTDFGDGDDFLDEIKEMIIDRAKMMDESGEHWDYKNQLCVLISLLLKRFDIDEIKNGITNALNPLRKEGKIRMILDGEGYLSIMTRLEEVARIPPPLPCSQEAATAMSICDAKDRALAMVEMLNRMVASRAIRLEVDESGRLHVMER